MHTTLLALSTLLATTLAAPQPAYIEERHIVEVEKRQSGGAGGGNLDQLLQLASLAGITALPTDPAVLLSLGPLAQSLASPLPAPSVLSVLLTAAPSGFVSSIVNDQSYAQSFESDFQAGNSPSWFNSLPTGVRSYLHTYSGFGGVVGAADAIEGAATGASRLASGESSEASSVSARASGAASGARASVTSAAGSAASEASESGASASESVPSSAATGEGADAQTTSEAGQGASTEGAGPTSASSDGGASRPTGVIAAGLLGAMGVLGVAAAL